MPADNDSEAAWLRYEAQLQLQETTASTPFLSWEPPNKKQRRQAEDRARRQLQREDNTHMNAVLRRMDSMHEADPDFGG